LQNQKGSNFPKEIDNLLGKRMLFKVDIKDGNIIHNWRNFTARRVTDDAGIIKQFMELHKIKVLSLVL
jgi:hypothetical protein